MSANGTRIATWMKITAVDETPNQMVPISAQPTEGNELISGLIRSWMNTCRAGT